LSIRAWAKAAHVKKKSKNKTQKKKFGETSIFLWGDRRRSAGRAHPVSTQAGGLKKKKVGPSHAKRKKDTPNDGGRFVGRGGPLAVSLL